MKRARLQSRSRRWPMIALLLTITCLSACDYYVAGERVFRGWVGQITDGLHELHGGEPHAGRRK